jgi:hypothetical protein
MSGPAWVKQGALWLAVAFIVTAPMAKAQRPTGDGVIYYRLGGGAAAR